MYQNDCAGSFSSLLNPCMPNVQNGERIVDPDNKSHAAIYIKRFGRLLDIIKGYSWSITWKFLFWSKACDTFSYIIFLYKRKCQCA